MSFDIGSNIFLLCLLSLNQQWTPDGDAFIIGSDVERLEADYLPKYFRTARFQSFVRQLSFYSFRKMNRERNMWVYKHDLFQRDKPELLHLVRRRTCPGNDKRKQRLPRAPKVHTPDNDNSDEVSSAAAAAPPESEKPAVADKPVVSSSKKRTMLVSDFEKPRANKRATPEPSSAVVVDTTVVQGWTAPAVSEESDDQASAAKVNDAEQSAIVSDVASKLAKYARLAQKGSLGRTRRSGTGMVTPPFGPSRTFKISSGNLLTYDDECGDYDVSDHKTAGTRCSDSNISSADSSPPKDKSVLEAVPFDVAQRIVKSVVDNSSEHPEQESLVLAANVASFCMAARPVIKCGKNLLCRKILDLFLSSESLAQEFLLYRSALYPLQNDEIRAGFAGPEERENGGLSTQNIWERADRRSDALREFSVFAVNRIFKVLDFGREAGDLSKESTTLLEQTAELWQKSAWSTD